VSGIDQFSARFDHSVEISTEWKTRIGKSQLEINHGDGRLFAETHFVPNATLLVKLAISFKDIL